MRRYQTIDTQTGEVVAESDQPKPRLAQALVQAAWKQEDARNSGKTSKKRMPQHKAATGGIEGLVVLAGFVLLLLFGWK